jgi:hypothetical protein
MRVNVIDQKRTGRDQRGALMAASLMMMVVVGIMLSGWVAIMATRAQQVSHMETAMQRRQALANSKVISRQLLMERGFAENSAVATGWTNLLQDGAGGLWGGSQVTAGWAGNVFGSVEDSGTALTSYPFNASGLTGGEAFLARRFTVGSGAMGVGMDPLTSHHFLKMTCPPLRGDLFTVYQKPPMATAELDVHFNTPGASGGHFAGWVVKGRMVIKDVPSLFSPSTPNPLVVPARVTSLYIPEERENLLVVGTNQNGQRMAPSNLAAVPMTVGSLPAGAGELWDDQLNVVRNDANPENSLWHFMDREQAAGRGGFVTINSADYSYGGADPPIWIQKQVDPPDLTDPLAVPTAADETEGLTYPPPRWPSGYPRQWRVLFVKLDHPDLPHLRIVSGVDQIIFLGQAPLSAAFTAAELLSPVMVTLVSPSAGQGVRDIRFEDVNNRRWVLGVKAEIATDLELYWEGDATLLTDADLGAGLQPVHLWRCVMVNEFRTVYANIYPGRNVRITGGVMTNWVFKRRKSSPGDGRNVNVPALTFERDVDPDPEGAAGPKFTSLLPRDAWMETYFRLNQP